MLWIAVVGGLSASQKSETQITEDVTSRVIRIVVNDIKNPSHNFDLNYGKDVTIEEYGNKGSTQNWCDLFNVIINQGDAMKGIKEPIEVNNKSKADELLKLANLKKKGILTSEEFDLEKQKLLQK